MEHAFFTAYISYINTVHACKKGGSLIHKFMVH